MKQLLLLILEAIVRPATLHPEKGSALLQTLLLSAGLGAVTFTLHNQTQNQYRVVDKMSVRSAEIILSKSIADAANSPFALVYSAAQNADLQNCVSTAGTCTPSALRQGFELRDAADNRIAGPQSDPLAFDKFGRICSPGANCQPRFLAWADFRTICLNNEASCDVAKDIIIGYQLVRLDSTSNATKTYPSYAPYTEPVTVAEGEAEPSAFECPAGEGITGFSDGEEVCGPIAMASFTPTPPPAPPTTTTTTTTSTVSGIPPCSNSTGEIPANRASRPALRSLPADKSSTEWTNWYNNHWFGGMPTNAKGPHACQEAAYRYNLHCAHYYSNIKTSAAHLVCGDFHDCNTFGLNFDCTFIELDPNNGCTMEFKGCRGPVGCFAAGTKIKLENGEEKTISSLKRGDLVFNPKTEKSYPITRLISGPELRSPMYEIVLANGKRLTLTAKHPLDTNIGLVLVRDLKSSHLLLDSSGNTTKINKIRRLHGYKKDVWNIQIGGSSDLEDHFVLANGIVSGDLYIQEQAEDEVKE